MIPIYTNTIREQVDALLVQATSEGRELVGVRLDARETGLATLELIELGSSWIEETDENGQLRRSFTYKGVVVEGTV